MVVVARMNEQNSDENMVEMKTIVSAECNNPFKITAFFAVDVGVVAIFTYS